MRLDSYSAAAYETFEPWHGDADAAGQGSPEDLPAPEPAAAQENAGQLLSEMARQQPVFVPLPQVGPQRRLPRLDEGDGWTLRERHIEERFQERFERDGGDSGSEPPVQAPPPPVAEAPPPSPAPAPEPAAPPPSAPAPVEAAAPIEAPAPAPAVPAPAATPAPARPAAALNATLALPLGAAVDPAWLQQREAALHGLQADFKAAAAAAGSAPPADLSATPGTGWTPAQTDSEGHPLPGAVWVPDAAAAAERAAVIANNWRIAAGIESAPPPAGQWLSFDEYAYADAYRHRAAERARAGDAPAPLAALGRLYDLPAADVLKVHPGLWTLATEAHALNAGPPPRPGVAMGDARTLGQLDLYLADPFITQLRTELGGAPAAPTSGLALEQQRLHGADRYAELTRLDQALAAVRQTHADAMRAAREGGGPGWVDVPMQTGTDPETGWPVGVYETVGDGEIRRDANGLPVLATTRVFDPARFTNAWLDDGLARGDLAARAFEQFYGRAHSEIARVESHRDDSTWPPVWESHAWLDTPALGLDAWTGTVDGDLVALDLDRPPRLNDDRAVGFDPQLGWVTARENLYEKRSAIDTALSIAAVAFVGWATAGAATAAGWGAVGSAAAAGAAASFAGGAINGNLSLKGVLIGAVSGALTAGLTPGLTSTLKDAGLGAAAGIAARMTVQGGIQALLGGKFKDGAIAGFASGLADLASANIGASIKQAVEAGTMTAGEALAARSFNTMLSSAIRAAGSPGDPAHAFASDWLNGLMAEFMPPTLAPAPAPVQGQGPWSSADHRNGSDVESDQTGEVQIYPVAAPGDVEVTPLPPGAVPAPPHGPGPVQGLGSTAPSLPSDEAGGRAPAAAPIEFMKQPDGQPVMATGTARPVQGELREAPDLAFPYPHMLEEGTRAQAFRDDAGQVYWKLEGPQVPGGSATVVVVPPLAAPDAAIDAPTTPPLQAGAAGAVALLLSDAERLARINAWLMAQGRPAVVGLAQAGAAVSEVLATGARLAGAALQAAEVASLAGLTVVAGAVNLVLLPPSRDSITPLGDGQRFVARPGELYGSLQVRDEDGHWQTVATDVRLVLNGTVRQALSDEEIAQLTRPLINVPPPAQPGSPPPLAPAQPDDMATLPGQPIDTPQVPDLQGLPIADPPGIDDIIITRSSGDARKLGDNLTAAGSPSPGVGYQPHHIVPVDAGGVVMDAIREKLKNLGIDINDAANGVWLPGPNANADAPEAYHPRLNNRVYNNAVAEALERVTTKDAAISALDRIARKLKEGDYPGVRPRP